MQEEGTMVKIKTGKGNDNVLKLVFEGDKQATETAL